MNFFQQAFNQIKTAGLETLEGIGEAAVSGVVAGISGASPTSQQNNAPDIGDTGNGRGQVVTQPVGTLMPQQSGVAGFLEGMPTWAKVLGGGSVLLLVGSVAALAVGRRQ